MAGMSSDDEAKLVKDLNQMVNNPELSDITFVCEDGIKVHACRVLLAARSSVFRQMLLNGMAESRESTVALPTVASSVLIIIIKFLYVGKLVEEDMVLSLLPSDSSDCVDTSGDGKAGPRWLDTNLLMKIIVAARFLMLDRIESLILDKLRNNLLVREVGCQTEETLNHSARILSSICAYPTLWTSESEVKAIDLIRLPIVQMLMFQDLSVATICCLSREGLEYYLTVARSASKDENWDSSLDEYLRLRQIITWCATKSRRSGVLNIDRRSLPGAATAIEFLEASEKSTEDADLRFDFSHGRSILVETISQEDIKPLLHMVDLASIHSELLVSVIEPLHIVDPVDLTAALSFQAVRTSGLLRKAAKVQMSNLWHLLNPSIEVWRKPTNDKLKFSAGLRRETTSFVVTAVVGVQIRPSSRYTFEVLAAPQGLMARQDIAKFQFGFIPQISGKSRSGDWSPVISSSVPSSTLTMRRNVESAFQVQGGPGTLWDLPGSKQWSWETPLNVTVNRCDNSCVFSYGGHSKSFPLHFYETVLHPTIKFEVTASDQDLFRPHYDYLTVGIKFLEMKIAATQLSDWNKINKAAFGLVDAQQVDVFIDSKLLDSNSTA